MLDLFFFVKFRSLIIVKVYKVCSDEFCSIVSNIHSFTDLTYGTFHRSPAINKATLHHFHFTATFLFKQKVNITSIIFQMILVHKGGWHLT